MIHAANGDLDLPVSTHACRCVMLLMNQYSYSNSPWQSIESNHMLAWRRRRADPVDVLPPRLPYHLSTGQRTPYDLAELRSTVATACTQQQIADAAEAAQELELEQQGRGAVSRSCWLRQLCLLQRHQRRQQRARRSTAHGTACITGQRHLHAGSVSW